MDLPCRPFQGTEQRNETVSSSFGRNAENRIRTLEGNSTVNPEIGESESLTLGSVQNEEVLKRHRVCESFTNVSKNVCGVVMDTKLLDVSFKIW